MGVKTNVKATALGGALGTIFVWILNSAGVSVPTDVAPAIATLFAVIVGWVVPDNFWSKGE